MVERVIAKGTWKRLVCLLRGEHSWKRVSLYWIGGWHNRRGYGTTQRCLRCMALREQVFPYDEEFT